MTEMNMLKKIIVNLFYELSDYIYKESLSISPAFYKPTFIDCWGGLYKVGHHAEIHDHWIILYSFVYYVNVSEECSILVLTDYGFYYIKPKKWIINSIYLVIKHFVPKTREFTRKNHSFWKYIDQKVFTNPLDNSSFYKYSIYRNGKIELC